MEQVEAIPVLTQIGLNLSAIEPLFEPLGRLVGIGGALQRPVQHRQQQAVQGRRHQRAGVFDALELAGLEQGLLEAHKQKLVSRSYGNPGLGY